MTKTWAVWVFDVRRQMLLLRRLADFALYQARF